MAEAMFLGKPVIATNYSSNTDFMTDDNGYLVRYTLRLVELSDHRYIPDCQYVYEPGQFWAEPDVEQAAEFMTYLYNHPDSGREKGQVAAKSIREFCNPDVVGHLAEQRLDRKSTRLN